MAETNIQNVKLKIGTKAQFQEKLDELPIGTLVGITDLPVLYRHVLKLEVNNANSGEVFVVIINSSSAQIKSLSKFLSALSDHVNYQATGWIDEGSGYRGIAYQVVRESASSGYISYMKTRDAWTLHSCNLTNVTAFNDTVATLTVA